MHIKHIFYVAMLCGFSAQAATQTLPPLPRGVTELKFSEFFVTPIGDRGLTFTEKLRGLEGKRVRIIGYMARQQRPTPGSFLLTPMPVQTDEDHYGLADDVPPASVRVLLPDKTDKLIPYTPRPLLLTGTLTLGNREEPDGRISSVRLTMELPKPVASATPGKGAQRLMKQ